MSISRKAVSLWWGRRDELDQIGALLPRWKCNFGRPVHKAFSTHEEKEKSIDLCEDLDIGEHQTDAARKLGCSLRTLRNHTHKTENWLFPPRRRWPHGRSLSQAPDLCPRVSHTERTPAPKDPRRDMARSQVGQFVRPQSNRRTVEFQRYSKSKTPEKLTFFYGTLKV